MSRPLKISVERVVAERTFGEGNDLPAAHGRPYCRPAWINYHMIVDNISRFRWLLFLGRMGSFPAMALLLASCAATAVYTPDKAPEYVVVHGYAPFYKLGPMQGRPDASLPLNTRVKLLRNESGYSMVQLDDARTGYVANDDIAPAPPRPPTPAVSDETSSTPSGKKRGRNVPNSPHYSGEQLNDIPLPAANVPAPDLNVGSEDVTVPAPTPTPPAEKPQFRY
jgi:hypothetical protein